MAAGSACVADLLDTVHLKMGSMVCGHHVYKSVRSPVIGKQLILEEPANPHNEFVVSVMKESQIVGRIPKNYSQITCMVFNCTKGLCHLKYRIRGNFHGMKISLYSK